MNLSTEAAHRNHDMRGSQGHLHNVKFSLGDGHTYSVIQFSSLSFNTCENAL